MIILIPWYTTGLLHIGLGMAAIISVFLTKAWLKNSWILIYFLLFFSINGYTITVMNKVDKAIARKIHSITQPDQAELYKLLRTMKLKPSPDHFQLNPSASARVYELLENGDFDLDYISPGYHRSMILMAATTGDSKMVKLMRIFTDYFSR